MGATHTPGPWCLLAVGDGTSRMCPADAERVSLLTIVEEGDADFAAVYNDADARLIAAAPELLQALKALRDECSGSPRPWVLVDLLTTATEAIAKAEERP